MLYKFLDNKPYYIMRKSFSAMTFMFKEKDILSNEPSHFHRGKWMNYFVCGRWVRWLFVLLWLKGYRHFLIVFSHNLFFSFSLFFPWYAKEKNPLQIKLSSLRFVLRPCHHPTHKYIKNVNIFAKGKKIKSLRVFMFYPSIWIMLEAILR